MVSELAIAEVWSPAEALHSWDPPDEAVLTVRRCRPTVPAAVLGSRQGDTLLDPLALERAGVGLVRRNSGGGLVLVDDALAIWVDVWIPNRPGSVAVDVRASMDVVGRAWVAALSSQDESLAERLDVHRGGVTRGEWADLVCFAGLGPGEVLLDGRKLVGLSQRRTREWSRVQCQVFTGNPSASAAALIAESHRPDDPVPDDPARVPRDVVESAAAALAGHLAEQLTDR